ncbi:hypothetical protein Slin_5865 [Spirosoma linguale DSM 74]|uniref:Uncharacterized protein n=1 Tax=Spirosoma linguale (strain ATCC 33905 / DSM 74 / LMG 10896 / Claus 1) TaxID=504472 RepID=D2QSP7_SPILD|nr:hypothetical protein Slin_5865 [Spirosoma linguale DSM 74]
MLIHIPLGCEFDGNSGRSECGLVLAALFEYREMLLLDPESYEPHVDAVFAQLDRVEQLINTGLLRALQSLEPLVIPDGTNKFKTVYAARTTSEGGRAE